MVLLFVMENFFFIGVGSYEYALTPNKIYRFASFCFFLIFLCVSCKPSVIYVSSSLGDDTYDGLTEKAPLKTIKAGLTRGNMILLRAGDVFYEHVDLKGAMLSSYGKGRKPKVCGYKRLIKPCWEQVDKNIWRISLADYNYSGFQTFGSSILNNIGCLHELSTDSVYGRKVQYRNQLRTNWDIWQTEKYDRNKVKAVDFDYLYLYLDRNPNMMELEFSVGISGVAMENASIDNIWIEGFGFGVSAKSNTVIRNCEIDAIGGMTQLNPREYVCYGNGIEYWIINNLKNGIVENNIISRCYDSACSIQGRVSSPENFFFRGNVIIDCCQGWEDFLTNEDEGVVYKNCVFEDNTVINSGKTSGFGYPMGRFKYCHVLGNNIMGNKGMIIRNNTFVGGNYYCSGAYKGKYRSNKWQGNTCIIKRGDFLLGNYMGTKDVIRVPVNKGVFRSLKEATDDAISRYRELTGDMTTEFIIKDEKAIDKQIKKLKKKYLKK